MKRYSTLALVVLLLIFEGFPSSPNLKLLKNKKANPKKPKIDATPKNKHNKEYYDQLVEKGIM